jgi:hypothetical protein
VHNPETVFRYISFLRQFASKCDENVESVSHNHWEWPNSYQCMLRGMVLITLQKVKLARARDIPQIEKYFSDDVNS